MWWLLSFLWCFLFALSSLNPATCRNCPKGRSAKRCKYYEQIPHNFEKTAVCSHRWPLRYPAPSLGHLCTGYSIGSSIQVRTFSPPSRGSAPPMIAGSLLSPQWATPPSSLQKGACVHYLWFYSFISFQKRLFYRNFTMVDKNSEQHHIAATWKHSSVEQKICTNLALGQSTFCRPCGGQH